MPLSIRITPTFNDNAALIEKIESGYRYCVVTQSGPEAGTDFEIWQTINDPKKQNSSFGDVDDTAFFKREDLARNFLSQSRTARFPLVLQVNDVPGSRTAQGKSYDITQIAQKRAAQTVLS